MSGTIIVDDRDPGLHYVNSGSDWQQPGGKPEEYLQTTTFASKPGASATFDFVGTKIEVFGTIPATVNPNVNATIGFAIDNGVPKEKTLPAIVSAPIAHQSFFSIDDLDPAEKHTLTITQRSDPGGFGVWFLDYLLYTPSNATNITDSTKFIVDDQDQNLVYSPREHWDSHTMNTPGNTTFQATAHAGGNQGDNITYTFTGTQISVYGPLDNQTPANMLKASFTIDDQPATTTQYSVQDASFTYNNQLFLSGSLPQGQHTLTMKYLSGMPLWLDYMLVSPGQSSHAPVPTSTSTPSNTKDKSNTAAIAGGVIGAVVVVVLLVAALLWWMRKRKAHTKFGLMSPRRSFDHLDLHSEAADLSPYGVLQSPEGRIGQNQTPAAPGKRAQMRERQERMQWAQEAQPPAYSTA